MAKIEVDFLARKLKFLYFKKKVARLVIRNVVKNETFLKWFSNHVNYIFFEI